MLKDCAALGIANVLVTPGEGTWTEDRLWQDKLAQTARERGIHLIGPDSVGIMRPDIGLNVSYIPKLAAAGPVGLVCQSAALTAAVLDYAAEAGFGFSSVISSGAEAATGLDEIVDFLAADAKTEIIALQILTVRHPRRLMSALKAAARVKPVIILPPGVSPAAGRLSVARHAVRGPRGFCRGRCAHGSSVRRKPRRLLRRARASRVRDSSQGKPHGLRG